MGPLITKLFMISASEPSSSPPQPMVILTISSLLLCPVSPAASDSQDNLTPISESSLLTLSHSPDSISSCKDSPHLPPEDLNNTEPSPSQDTEDISPPPHSSEEECPPRRSMSKCLMSKTRTPLISLSGSQITSNLPSAISHQRVSRCPSPSSVTLPPSKKCSRE